MSKKTLFIAFLSVTCISVTTTNCLFLTSCGSNQQNSIYYDFFKYELNNDDQTYTFSIDWEQSTYKKEEFNEKIIVPTNNPNDGKPIAKISDNFLMDCTSFNQEIIIPSTITSIGKNFLYNCTSFNQPLDLSSCNITTIDDIFLGHCESFNQPIKLPNDLKIIGWDFMSNCYKFNQPLKLDKNLKQIKQGFMWNCKNFTNTLIVNCQASIFDISNNTCATDNSNDDCYKIGIKITGDCAQDFINQFKNNNTSPYRKLVLKQSTFDFFIFNLNDDNETYTISTNWEDSQYDQEKFNEKIIIPSNHPDDNKPITKIGDDFLSGCIAFNQELIIPKNIQSIGDFFLYECKSFSQPLTIPKTIQTIGDVFLSQNYNFIGALTIDCPVDRFGDNDDYTCATDNINAPCYQNGIVIAGDYAQGFKEKFKDSTFPYRKLILKNS